MNHIRYSVIAIAMAALMGGAGVQAADSQSAGGAFIRDLKGEVLINNGKDYVPASAGDSLNVGGRVLVKESGDATVVLQPEGREIHVGPGEMYEYRGGKPTVAGAGAAGVVYGLSPGALGGASTKGGLSSTDLLIGLGVGAGVAGAVMGGIALSEDNNNRVRCQDPPSCSVFR